MLAGVGSYFTYCSPCKMTSASKFFITASISKKIGHDFCCKNSRRLKLSLFLSLFVCTHRCIKAKRRILLCCCLLDLHLAEHARAAHIHTRTVVVQQFRSTQTPLFLIAYPPSQSLDGKREIAGGSTLIAKWGRCTIGINNNLSVLSGTNSLH